MGIERLCRNGRHPIDYRITNRDGRTTCQGCHDEREATQVTAGLRHMGPWQTPAHDEVRAKSLAVWAAGVDAAIEEIRRTEGFDGRHQTWMTLGEFLAPDPTPAPYKEPVRLASADRRVVLFPPPPAGRRYVGNETRSTRMARFQARLHRTSGAWRSEALCPPVEWWPVRDVRQRRRQPTLRSARRLRRLPPVHQPADR